MTIDFQESGVEALVEGSSPVAIDGPAGPVSSALADAPVVLPVVGVASPTPITRSARLRQFARPSLYYLLSRIVVLFAALAAKWMVPRLNPFKALTTGWDGYWYNLIAQHGYPSQIFNENHGSRWAFFPAYPAVIRATVDVTGLSYGGATFLLTLILGLTATLAIWLAVRQVFGTVVADRSVLLFVFFPATYVLSMAYTEGLFLTAAAGCLYALSKKYWVTASLFAVLASLTRSFGVVLIVCVVVTAVPIILKERKIRPLVAIAIAPVGFLGWLAYSWAIVGNPLAFVSAEKIWSDSHFVWFLTPLIACERLLTNVHSWANGQFVLTALAVVFAYGGFFLLAKAKDRGVSVPFYWWVFTIGSIMGMMSASEPASVLRYSLGIIPLFAAYAWRMKAAWEGPVVGVLAMSQGVLAVIVIVGTLHPHTATIWP